MSEAGTLVESLARAARSSEGVVFLSRDEETFVSYRTIRERALRAAAALEGWGVRPRDRVGIVVPTGAPFYDAFFGALALGAVPVSMPPPPRFGKLDAYREATAAMAQAAGVRVVVADAAGERKLEALGARSLEDLPTASATPLAPGPDDLAVVQFSSGTTGVPKPVALTHRQILANVGAILEAMLGAYPPGEGHRHGGVSWLPLYHDMGLVGAMLTALVHPGPLALLKPEEFVARPARWLRAISRFEATVSAAPNFAYELAVDRIRDEELEGVDLSSWLFALDGAETVVPSTLEKFHRRFGPYGLRRESLKPVYGLAEAALAVSFPEARRDFVARRFDRGSLAPDHPVEPSSDGLELASCGPPLPGYAVRILGSCGSDLGEGWVGRVLVSGPSLMKGYLGQEEATREVLRDGWLDTGDLGFLLDGELYLCGRAKDVIVVRGRNYAPDVIERAVAGAPGVRPGSVAAVSVLGERGDVLCLLAEREPGGDVDERDLRARLLEGLGVEPGRVVLLEAGSLPRTSSGKIRRQEAARRFASV